MHVNKLVDYVGDDIENYKALGWSYLPKSQATVEINAKKP